MQFEKCRILITGGGSGIGRALARIFAREGAEVLIAGRNSGAMAETAGDRDAISCITADVTAREGRAAILEAVAARPGKLDILVNNAGIQNTLDFTIAQPASLEPDITREIATNLTAPILLTAALLPAMARPSRIVNITSMLAIHPKASAPVYCASKAGLQSFSRALRHQLRERGISVTEVLPPLVDTAMTAANARRRKISPEQCAAAIADGIARGRDRIAVGPVSPFLVLNRIAPRLAARILIAN